VIAPLLALAACDAFGPVDAPYGTWKLVGVESGGDVSGAETTTTQVAGCPRSRTTFTFVRERLTVSHDALCEGAGGWWTCGAHLTVPVRWTERGLSIDASGEGWGRLAPLEVHVTEFDELPPPDTRCSVAVSAASFRSERSGDHLALRDTSTGTAMLLRPASRHPPLDGWRRELLGAP
jgi:hypothetical protein